MALEETTTSGVSGPLLKLRHIPLIFLGIAMLIAGPLCIVWKQVYINELSMRKKTLNESIVRLSAEATRLQLIVEKLSSPLRIEKIAREHLTLDYPVASQMVIVKETAQDNKSSGLHTAPMHALSRLLSGDGHK
jgi:cell division protein FtsL